jgi:hypothetical protein
MKVIEMLFSDVSFGTHQYGFIPRRETDQGCFEEPECEDYRYSRFLQRKGVPVKRVYGGKVWVSE